VPFGESCQHVGHLGMDSDETPGQIIVELVVMAESLISWQFKLPKLEMILK